ncbi:MAG: prenyltransferase [Candidatus Omnitrophica bacterium]|nr:prenyltransferase [Candidatus Omnitrophota bacterium]
MGSSNIKNYTRALRLPFVTASLFPFIFGSLLSFSSWLNFILGLTCAIATHLGANLINDYADSKSGADWQDTKFYRFFGGSKLIQEGVFSEKFYLKNAIFAFLLALACVLILAARFKNLSVLGYYLFILFLGFSYSHKPLKFSYHRLGELIIFLLFGPALVMGALFIQTQHFPTLQGFLLSIPLGIFTTAILFANEIPDYLDDRKANKFTLVSLFGPKKSYIFYYLLLLVGFSSIIINVILGYLDWPALLALALALLGYKAGKILKENYADKTKLINSAKMTIALHSLVSIILILSLIL